MLLTGWRTRDGDPLGNSTLKDRSETVKISLCETILASSLCETILASWTGTLFSVHGLTLLRFIRTTCKSWQQFLRILKQLESIRMCSIKWQHLMPRSIICPTSILNVLHCHGNQKTQWTNGQMKVLMSAAERYCTMFCGWK